MKARLVERAHDERGPNEDEDDERTESAPLCEPSDGKAGRDGGEHELVWRGKRRVSLFESRMGTEKRRTSRS